MHHKINHSFRLASVIILSALSSLFAGNEESKNFVWAHYTPWLTPLNSSITTWSYYNYPLFHSSGNAVRDWAEEFRQAKAQGIDGFLVDVVMSEKGNPAAYSSTLHDMLKAAEGSDFKVAMCLDVKTSIDYQIREVSRMLTLFGQHPNYSRVHGRPVVATYTWKQWTPEEWQSIREGLHKAGHDIYLIANHSDSKTLGEYLPHFDMAYFFGMFGLNGIPYQQNVDNVANSVRNTGKDYMASLIPGYYGAWLNGRNDYYQPHRGFDQLHDCFEIIRKERDRWMHFSTWNDHDETSILPMLFTSANPRITKSYSDSFKSIAPEAREPQVCLAYHREEIPGTLLRIEALSLPSALPADTEITVTGRLLDQDGAVATTLEAKVFPVGEYARTEWLIPTHTLAHTPTLTPEVTVSLSDGYSHTTRLPPILLVHGWHQNAVTVKVPVDEYITFPNALRLLADETSGIVTAAIDFDAPEEIRAITLFRNDRPIAAFDSQTENRTLLNIFIEAGTAYDLRIAEGEIIQAVQKHAEKDAPGFTWDKTGLRSDSTLDWTPSGFTCAVSAGARFTIATPGAPSFEISADELNRRGFIRHGKLSLQVSPVDVTVQNRPVTPALKGSRTLSLLTREPHINDMYYVRYETVSGRTALSPIVYPFARKNALIPVNLVRTSINLETTSGETGMPGRSEYLTPKDQIPFQTPDIAEARIPLHSIRAGGWTFDGNGRDFLGDMPVNIPPELFARADDAGKDSGNKVLSFDGKKKPLKMQLRTWPIGNTTIDFRLKPAPDPVSRQVVLERRGWSDGINIHLRPDGRVEVIRNGNENVRTEAFTSTGKLPFGEWSRLRVTNDSTHIRIYINGSLDSEFPVSPARSYGNSTWFVGGGSNQSQNYHGQIDDLMICGAAFAPDDANCPFDRAFRSQK